MLLANLPNFETGVETTKNLAEAWDLVWEKVFLNWNSPQQTLELSTQVLYTQICYVGLVIASALLIFLAIRQFKDLKDGNHEQYYLSLLMPLIAAILLSNNGSRLADLTMLMRDTINQINVGILDSAIEGQNLEDAYQEFLAGNAYSQIAPNLHTQCQVLTGQEQLDCLAAAVRQTMEMNPESNEQPASSTVVDANPWAVLGSNDGDISSDGTANENPSRTLADPNYYNRPLFNTAGETTIFTTLYALQSAYQQLQEVSLLFTALAGPIAVGASLTPLGATNTLAAFLTAFYSVGIAKLTFNLTAGFAALANNLAAPSDPLPLAALTAFGAPIISAALATGGGMAIWMGITSATANIAETGLKLLGRFI